MTHKDSPLSKLKQTPHNKPWVLKDVLNHMGSSMNSVTLLAHQAAKKMQPFEAPWKKKPRHKDLPSFLWNLLASWYSWNIPAQTKVITVKKKRLATHQKFSLFWDITHTEFFYHTLHIHFMYYILHHKTEIALHFCNVFLKQAMNGKKTPQPPRYLKMLY